MTQRNKTISIILYVIAGIFTCYALYQVYSTAVYINSAVSSGSASGVGFADIASVYYQQISPYLFYGLTLFSLGWMTAGQHLADKQAKANKIIGIILYVIAAFLLIYACYSIYSTAVYVNSAVSSGAYTVTFIDILGVYFAQVGPYFLYTIGAFAFGWIISGMDKSQEKASWIMAIVCWVLAAVFAVYALYSIYATIVYLNSVISSGYYSIGFMDIVGYLFQQLSAWFFYAGAFFGFGWLMGGKTGAVSESDKKSKKSVKTQDHTEKTDSKSAAQDMNDAVQADSTDEASTEGSGNVFKTAEPEKAE